MKSTEKQTKHHESAFRWPKSEDQPFRQSKDFGQNAELTTEKLAVVTGSSREDAESELRNLENLGIISKGVNGWIVDA